MKVFLDFPFSLDTSNLSFQSFIVVFSPSLARGYCADCCVCTMSPLFPRKNTEIVKI